MSRITPLALEEASPEDRALLERGAEWMGFLPNDGLLMARVPGLLAAASELVRAAYGAGALDMDTKRLVSVMSSAAAGCRYCQAHTRHGALKQGIEAERLEAIWEYESSPLFNDAERAAIHFARLASLTPNGVEAADMDALRAHYTEEQVLEIVAVIALFGFLNRWNDTLKTDIEAAPRAALEPEHAA